MSLFLTTLGSKSNPTTDVEGINQEFLSEDYEQNESLIEDGKIQEVTVERSNGNQNKSVHLQRSQSPLPGSSGYQPEASGNPEIDHDQNREEAADTLQLMQSFMVQNRLIEPTMNEEQIIEFIKGKQSGSSVDKQPQVNQPSKQVAQTPAKQKVTGNRMDCAASSSLEVTIYKRAVKQIAPPELDKQIEQLFNDMRRKVSSSSEEMDTSEEMIDQDLLHKVHYQSISDGPGKAGGQGQGQVIDEEQQHQEKEFVDAETAIKDVECSKARMFELSGNNQAINYVHIDIS